MTTCGTPAAFVGSTHVTPGGGAGAALADLLALGLTNLRARALKEPAVHLLGLPGGHVPQGHGHADRPGAGQWHRWPTRSRTPISTGKRVRVRGRPTTPRSWWTWTCPKRAAQRQPKRLVRHGRGALGWVASAAMVALVWFRRDLRVHDHPALCAALAGHEQIVPVFCLDDRLLHGRRASGARTAFLLQCLTDLDERLTAHGARLVIRHGPPERELPALARESEASEVHLDADPSPYEATRGRRVRARPGAGRSQWARAPWGERGGRRARDPDRAPASPHGSHPRSPQLAGCPAAGGRCWRRHPGSSACRHGSGVAGCRRWPAWGCGGKWRSRPRRGERRAGPAGRVPGGAVRDYDAGRDQAGADGSSRLSPYLRSAACRRARWKAAVAGGAAGSKGEAHSGASCAGGTSTSTSWSVARRIRGWSSSRATGARWPGRATTRSSPHGPRARPGTRWWTRGCASCAGKAGCTTGCGCSQARS